MYILLILCQKRTGESRGRLRGRQAEGGQEDVLSHEALLTG